MVVPGVMCVVGGGVGVLCVCVRCCMCAGIVIVVDNFVLFSRLTLQVV